MRIVSGLNSANAETLKFDNVSRDDVPDTLRRYMQKRTYKLTEVRQLLRSMTLVQSEADEYEGGWFDLEDSKGQNWWVVVDHKLQKKWDAGRKGLIARLAASLMLSARGLDTMALSVVDDRGDEMQQSSSVDDYHLYDRTENGNWAEYVMKENDDPITGRELSALLVTARGCDGVPSVRRCIDLNGTYYGKVSKSRFGKLELAQNEVPEFTIRTSGPDLAYKYIRPLIGEKCYDLLSMVFGYSLIEQAPKNYFIASDSGGTGKTTLLTSFCDRFSTVATAKPNMAGLTSTDRYANGLACAQLIGKRFAFVDEAGKLGPKAAQVLAQISTGSNLTARFGNAQQTDFYCRAVLFLATNVADELPDITATNRRRVNVDFNRAKDGAWEAPLEPADAKKTSRAAGKDIDSVHTYAEQGRCMDEMVAHGIRLILERQKETKKYDIFDGLSMEDKVSARNAFGDNEDIIKLATMLSEDPEVQAWLDPECHKKNCNTRIKAKGLSAESLLPSVRNPEVIFKTCGINLRNGRRQLNGKLERVIQLTDKEKAQNLWDVLDDNPFQEKDDIEQLGKVLQYNGDEMQYNSAEHNDVAVEVNRKIQSKLGPDYEVSLKMRGRKPWLLITKNNTVLADLHLLCMNSEKPQPGEDAIRIRPYGETTVYMSDEPGKNAPGLLIQRIRNGEAIGHRKA
ncbi:primase-helicase family protein [Bifidobacterium vansinderenii]|uniref:Uncharacterized protein n=1 Tax=Bifidobacterium vansinderenii TaxID=1984871 RepID=A0A229VXQ1_9BIFI|nr:primase-helicase family protein [Bifidobacterium vansinderenii]OXN00404.1 hypothetical protein Tam10B_1274 [Bifidobacterium vansinderenii]